MDGIVGWQKNSFIDFPGTVATVLFLSGCSLRCPYCHNPEVVLGEHEPIPYELIKEFLVKRKGIIEGAVISGGEPLIHSELKPLCDDLRSFGLRIKIDTNGLEPEKIIDCAPDYLALDIKTSLEKYPRLNVLQSYNDYRERLGISISIAKRMGKNAEARITAVPGIVDGGDIDGIIVELRGINKVYIQQFVPRRKMIDPAYASVKPYEPRELEIWRDKFLNAGIDCDVRA